MPGVGSLLITSILTRDYSIIQFVALVLAILVIIVNLLTDLAYALLDPRVLLPRMSEVHARRCRGPAGRDWILPGGVVPPRRPRRLSQ